MAGYKTRRASIPLGGGVDTEQGPLLVEPPVLREALNVEYVAPGLLRKRLGMKWIAPFQLIPSAEKHGKVQINGLGGVCIDPTNRNYLVAAAGKLVTSQEEQTPDRYEARFPQYAPAIRDLYNLTPPGSEILNLKEVQYQDAGGAPSSVLTVAYRPKGTALTSQRVVFIHRGRVLYEDSFSQAGTECLACVAYNYDARKVYVLQSNAASPYLSVRIYSSDAPTTPTVLALTGVTAIATPGGGFKQRVADVIGYTSGTTRAIVFWSDGVLDSIWQTPVTSTNTEGTTTQANVGTVGRTFETLAAETGGAEYACAWAWYETGPLRKNAIRMSYNGGTSFRIATGASHNTSTATQSISIAAATAGPTAGERWITSFACPFDTIPPRTDVMAWVYSSTSAQSQRQWYGVSDCELSGSEEVMAALWFDDGGSGTVRSDVRTLYLSDVWYSADGADITTALPPLGGRVLAGECRRYGKIVGGQGGFVAGCFPADSTNQAATRVVRVQKREVQNIGMTAEYNGVLVAGGAPYLWDGTSHPPAAGFAFPPTIWFNDLGAGTSSGVFHRACYAYTTANGQIIRSEPSAAIQIAAGRTGDIHASSHPFMSQDPASVRVELYESTDGENYYLIEGASVAQAQSGGLASAQAFTLLAGYGGAGTYAIDLAAPLYTNGGVVPYTLPEPSYQVVQWGRRTWTCGGNRRVWYSLEHVPGEAPAWSDALTLNVGGDPITALCPLGDRLLLWTERECYVISGDGPNDTGAGGWQSPQRVGLIGVAIGNPYAVAETPAGAFFVGTDGNVWQVGPDLSLTNRSGGVYDYRTTYDNDFSETPTWVSYDPERRLVQVAYASYVATWSTEYNAWTRQSVAGGGYGGWAPIGGLWVTQSADRMSIEWKLRANVSDYIDTGASGDIPYSCTVSTAPIKPDGPGGLWRCRRSSWVVRCRAGDQVTLNGYPNSVGSTYSAHYNYKDTSSFYATSPDAEYKMPASAEEGFQTFRLHHQHQRCSEVILECVVEPVGATNAVAEFAACVLEYAMPEQQGRGKSGNNA